jgi:hypothetical protein
VGAERGWSVRSEADEDGYVIVERTLPRPDYYQAPKFVECARRIAASPHCGHVIFCEPTATHQWIRETLVEHGIPRDRIAILNAETSRPPTASASPASSTASPASRPRPAPAAVPAKPPSRRSYDVLIGNSVANEGIDLQVRTCMLHHIDMPWTSADLEQRNGRGVRQGNTLGTVNIFYYFADRSMDGYRFDLVNGKATWLADLLKSQARDTNNPAAQQQLTPEDILLMISRDKEKTQRMLDEKKKRKIAETRAWSPRRPPACCVRPTAASATRARARAPSAPPSCARRARRGSRSWRRSTPRRGRGAHGCTPSATPSSSSPRTAAPSCTRACASPGRVPAPPGSSNTSSSAASSPPRTASASACAPPARRRGSWSAVSP